MEIQFTSENFETEVLKSEVPVLVDFYADWCGPCKMMGPVVEELAEEYRDKVKVGKLNVDVSDDIAAKYRVMTIPTILVISNGEVTDKFVGVQSKTKLMDALNKAL